MTMERLLNVMTVFSLMLIVFVLRSVRGAHIRVEYSVSWLGASLTLLILSRWRGALEWLGRFLGIDDAGLALVFIVGCLFLVVFYRFSIVMSELKDANISLAQRVAILEFQLRSRNEEQETNPAI
jgi:hypothetical protein